MNSIKVISIVGRPNVGKSSLFNIFFQKRLTLEAPSEHTTRDYITRAKKINGSEYLFIDSAGLNNLKKLKSQSENIEFKAIKKSLDNIYISDLILYVVDSIVDLSNDEINISRVLLKSKKPVLLLINKIDKKDNYRFNYLKLGFKDYIFISTSHRSNIDQIYRYIDNFFYKERQLEFEEKLEDFLRFTILGRPNVGKSSLFNLLINQDRAILSATSHTTRDINEVEFVYNKHKYLLCDTGGIVFKRQYAEKMHYLISLISLKTLNTSDAAVIVIDGSEGIVKQDLKIIYETINHFIPFVLVINKSDLLSEQEKSNLSIDIEKKINFFKTNYIVWTSCLEKLNFLDIFKFLETIKTKFSLIFDDQQVNNLIHKLLIVNPPLAVRHKRLKIFNASLKCQENKFYLYLTVNQLDLLSTQYQQFLKNKCQQFFKIIGHPIKIVLKQKYWKEKKIKNI